MRLCEREEKYMPHSWLIFLLGETHGHPSMLEKLYLISSTGKRFLGSLMPEKVTLKGCEILY